ncbi:MAG TPA: hydroxymethylglutaryl-CoA reductase, degradative [Anaeromyxobacteraceae bacterium]|nr:hydroxymethylglutaryl-CoA reductase, degradative [Anaeromyxobacteraceae bacterium]
MKPVDLAQAAPPASQLRGFHQGTPGDRRNRLVQEGWLATEDAAALASGVLLEPPAADAMIENVVGTHALPLAIATNFVVNGRDVLVPMVVEEPSIVAAASYAARMIRAGGGFTVSCDAPLLAAQVQLVEVGDVAAAEVALRAAEREILALADECIPAMVTRGGGARALEVRAIAPDMVVVHVLVDCQDAMGANLVNTVAEEVAPLLAERAGAKVGLRILTNLCDRRKVTVGVRVPTDALRSSNHPDGAAVRDGVVAAQRFAELDPYRATTHNKGVMNGVDAVLLACGNDWRAVEAGAHAYAARNGRYEPLTRWWAAEDGALAGELTMPLAASTVGGAARNHRGVVLSLRMARLERAADLAAIAGAAGLASNLAALRALSTDGIQRGHMALHARRIAAEVGADGDLVDAVAARLSAERTYRPERAAAILADLRARAG